MAKNKNNKQKKQSTEDIVPPVSSCKDTRANQPEGGRSDPKKTSAPDGISGNWK